MCRNSISRDDFLPRVGQARDGFWVQLKNNINYQLDWRFCIGCLLYRKADKEVVSN